MNKLISIQQVKKSGDAIDEQDQIEDFTEEELSELNNTYLNDIMCSNCDEANSSNIDKLSIQNNLDKSEINQECSKSECDNEQCKEIIKEIQKYSEECDTLEKKITKAEKEKTEEFFEISTKLSQICKEIDNIQPLIDGYQGQNLYNLSYEQLTKIEINLLRLNIKVRAKISKTEMEIMKGNLEIPKDTSIICKFCKINEINCLLHPCNHIAICIECASKNIKCPICYKFIEYFEKIYLPTT